MVSQRDVDNLESAIRGLGSALETESKKRDVSVAGKTLKELFVKLEEVLAYFSESTLPVVEERILTAISDNRPDIEGAESRIIGAIPALDGIESLLGENGGSIGKLSEEIKKLSSTVVKFMVELPEPVEREFPEFAELSSKLDKLMESPEIIEQVTEDREKREWNFVVKRGHTGLIENVIAEEI